MLLAPGDRGAAGCGDYEQTMGQLRFNVGAVRAILTINLMDDLCRERYPEYIQLTISVPGSASLQGEKLSAIVRIDDDDNLMPECS